MSKRRKLAFSTASESTAGSDVDSVVQPGTMTTPAELAASLRQRNAKKKKAVSVSSSATDDDDYQDEEVEQSGYSGGAA